MAEAKLIPPEKPTVELSLTAQEAFFLRDLMKCIAGHPDTTPRQYANQIFHALVHVDLSAGRYTGGSLSGRVECGDF